MLQEKSTPESGIQARMALSFAIVSMLMTILGLVMPVIIIRILSLFVTTFSLAFLVHLISSMRRQHLKRERARQVAEQELLACQHQLKMLIPALDLLHLEDTALVALLAISREPIPGVRPAASELLQVQAYCSNLHLPDPAFLKKAEALAAIHSLGEQVQSIELRMPYVKALLGRVVDHTEKAAMTLIDRFSDISEQTGRAEDQAKNAMAAMGSDGATDVGLDQLIQQSQASIVGRTGVINEFLQLNRENSERVRKIAELVTRSEELLSGIEDISERSKLIAFNMAVESAKIGERGQGFKVIVHELQNLNNQTSQFAHNILEIVKSLRGYNEELMDQWLVKSVGLTEKVKDDTHQAENAVSAMTKSYNLTANLFRSLSESTISVNRSMSAILESLQFQDITRQQIEGAEAFLSDMESTLLHLHQFFTELGCPMGDVRQSLLQIRSNYRPKLKVSSDHDIFDQIERSSL